MKLLVTGGAGFIGSNFIIQYLQNHPQDSIRNLDALTYAGNLSNLTGIDNSRYEFVRGSVCDAEKVQQCMDGIDVVINFAAETHVDRSILNAQVFVETNVLGTTNLLAAARANNIRRFIQISTDEVYGALGKTGAFTESTPLNPSSPYSASKTSADLLALSWFHTYGFPVIVTRCSNNYGPRQFPEKLIPLMITNALHDKKLPVYGDGKNVRDWIHVDDHNRAVELVIEKGIPGEVYNIGSENEWENIDIIHELLKILNKPESLIEFVKDRPGHDWRYAINPAKIKKELGFTCQKKFTDGLRETVNWYLQNQKWWEEIKNGRYLEYYREQYENRN